MYYTSIDNNNELVDYVVWCYVYKCPKCNYETTSSKFVTCPKCKTHLTTNSIHYTFFNDQLYKNYLVDNQIVYIPVRNIYNCAPCRDLSKINGTIKIGHYTKQLQKNDEFYYDSSKIVFMNKDKPKMSQSATPMNRKITIVKKGKVESVHTIIPQLRISNIKYDFTLFKDFNDNISTICVNLDELIKHVESHSCYANLHYFIDLLHSDFAKSIIDLEVCENDDDDVVSYLNVMKSLINYVRLVCEYYDEVYRQCKLFKELNQTIDGLTQEDVNEILNNKIESAKYLKYKLSNTNSCVKMASEINKYITAINY